MSMSREQIQPELLQHRLAAMRRCLVRLAHGPQTTQTMRLVRDLADHDRQLDEAEDAWIAAAKGLERVVAWIEDDHDKRTGH